MDRCEKAELWKGNFSHNIITIDCSLRFLCDSLIRSWPMLFLFAPILILVHLATIQMKTIYLLYLAKHHISYSLHFKIKTIIINSQRSFFFVRAAARNRISLNMTFNWHTIFFMCFGCCIILFFVGLRLNWVIVSTSSSVFVFLAWESERKHCLFWFFFAPARLLSFRLPINISTSCALILHNLFVSYLLRFIFSTIKKRIQSFSFLQSSDALSTACPSTIFSLEICSYFAGRFSVTSSLFIFNLAHILLLLLLLPPLFK